MRTIYALFNQDAKSVVAEYHHEHVAEHEAEKRNMEIFAEALETAAPGNMPAFPETFTVMDFPIEENTCPGCTYACLPCRAGEDADLDLDVHEWYESELQIQQEETAWLEHEEAEIVAEAAEHLEADGHIEPDTIRVGYEGEGSYTVWWMLVYEWGAVQQHKSCPDRDYALCQLYDLMLKAGEPSWMISAEIYEMVDEALKDWLEKYDSEASGRLVPEHDPVPEWLKQMHREELFVAGGIGIAIGAVLPLALAMLIRYLL